MTYYRSLKDVPELHGFGLRERWRIHRACIYQNKHFLFFQLVLCVTGALAGFALIWIPLSTVTSEYPLLAHWCRILAPALGGGLASGIAWQITVSRLRPFYASYIATLHADDVA